MSHHIVADQIAEDTARKRVRRKMSSGSNSRYAYCGRERVDADLGELVGILGRYYAREGPGIYRVARWKAIRDAPRSVRPESSGTVSLIRSLAVRREL